MLNQSVGFIYFGKSRLLNFMFPSKPWKDGPMLTGIITSIRWRLRRKVCSLTSWSGLRSPGRSRCAREASKNFITIKVPADVADL